MNEGNVANNIAPLLWLWLGSIRIGVRLPPVANGGFLASI
jgi:hypothetical protein